MKILCQACGKTYESDQDELCPKCGSYNPIDKQSTDRRLDEEASDSRRRNLHYREVANSQNDMADVDSSSAHNTEYGGSYEATHGRPTNTKARPRVDESLDDTAQNEKKGPLLVILGIVAAAVAVGLLLFRAA